MNEYKENFKIIFLGTPDFAVASLKILVESNYNIVGVITAPDKPAGRGKKLQESAVKQYAQSVGLRIFQPVKLKDEKFLDELKNLNADLQVVVAFRMLPESVWNMPRCGTINLHGSLLPQYRGAAPLNWAIMNGEKESGVTTFLLQQEIDTGRVIEQVKHPIMDNDNVGDLHDALMDIGAKLVAKTVGSICSGELVTVEQSQLINEPLKCAPKIFKEDCKIDWLQPIDKIHNKIRGLSPYPTAWTILNYGEKGNKSLKIFSGKKELCITNVPLGTIDSDSKSYFRVSVDGGWLYLTLVQLEGKKRMCIEEFLNGFSIQDDIKLI